eukprot:symbB.v1.2.005503.t1/scaffold310.1/size231343/8
MGAAQCSWPAAECSCPADPNCKGVIPNGIEGLALRVDWGTVPESSDREDGSSLIQEPSLPVTPRGLMVIPPSDESHAIAWQEWEETWPHSQLSPEFSPVIVADICPSNEPFNCRGDGGSPAWSDTAEVTGQDATAVGGSEERNCSDKPQQVALVHATPEVEAKEVDISPLMLHHISAYLAEELEERAKPPTKRKSTPREISARHEASSLMLWLRIRSGFAKRQVGMANPSANPGLLLQHSTACKVERRRPSAQVVLNRQLASSSAQGILELFFRRQTEFNEVNLATAIFRLASQGWTFRSRDATGIAVQLLQHICERVDNFGAQGIANTAWSLTKIRATDEPLLVAISRAVQRSSQLSPQGLSNIAWWPATLQCLGTAVGEQLADAAMKSL